MYSPSNYLFFNLSAYIYRRPSELVTKVEPNINSVEIHPQVNNMNNPVDAALVGAGSLWPWHTFPNLHYTKVPKTLLPKCNNLPPTKKMLSFEFQFSLHI
jgi:hypothetical protein